MKSGAGAGPQVSPNSVIPTGTEHRKAMSCGVEGLALLRQPVVRDGRDRVGADENGDGKLISPCVTGMGTHGGCPRSRFSRPGSVLPQLCHPDRNRTSQSDELWSGGTLCCYVNRS